MPYYAPTTNLEPQAYDFGLKAWNFDWAQAPNTQAIPTAGTLYLQKVFVRQPTLISSVWVLVTAAGATLTNVGFALYDATTTNLLTSSVNANGATTTAFTSGGANAKQITFSTPQTVYPSFYVGFWFTGTTLPTLQRGTGAGPSQANPGLSAGSYRFASANTSLTTTAPGTYTTQTAGQYAWWVGAA